MSPRSPRDLSHPAASPASLSPQVGSPPTFIQTGSPPTFLQTLDSTSHVSLRAQIADPTVIIPSPSIHCVATLPSPMADSVLGTAVASTQTLPSNSQPVTAAFWQDLARQSTELPCPPSVITMKTVVLAQDMLRLRVRHAVQLGTRHLMERMQAAGIKPPTMLVNEGPMDFLDQAWPSILADLEVHESMSPGQLVEAVRGQTSADYRPNKALWPDDLRMLYQGYHHLDTMLTIASSGFRIPRTAPLPQQPVAPSNHGSARKHDATLMRLMREGQAAHQYVFLQRSVQQLWPHLCFYSPLGLVPKGKLPMTEIARVIQDLLSPSAHLSTTSPTKSSYTSLTGHVS